MRRSNLFNQIIILITLSVLLGFVAGYFGAKFHGRYHPAPSTTDRLLEVRQKITSESEHIADIASKVGPSIVSIRTTQRLGTPAHDIGRLEAGTGIIVTSDGYIITNRHLIPEDVQKIEIELSDGTIYDDVDIIGRDPRRWIDIAFLKINGVDDLAPAEFGDSDGVKVGDYVIAIGNVLGQYSNSVTTGIISGRSRPVTVADDNHTTERLTNLLQTDAAINLGNSGGPLININGQVVGINTAVADANSVGFAIPVNDIMGIISGVISTGRYIVPYLGVTYEVIDEQYADERGFALTEGAHIVGDSDVSGVVDDSPAAKAGIKDNDIVTEVNDIKVDQYNPLRSLVGRYQPGDVVSIGIYRDNQHMSLDVTLGELP